MLNDLSPLKEFKTTDQGIAQCMLKDKIELLYKQLPVALLAEVFAFVIFALGISSYGSNLFNLKIWLIYMIVLALIWPVSLVAFRLKPALFSYPVWLLQFALLTFFSGIGWGLASVLLLPADSILHQSFAIILIFGLVAGAVPFLSPVMGIYLLFLLPTAIPLILWLFLQSEIHILIGYCAIIYTLTALASSIYANQYLNNALSLGYKNINLDSLNQILEKKVALRTRELEQTLALTRSTLESTADGIIVVNASGKLDYYNQKFVDLWKIVFSTNQTFNFQDFFPQLLQEIQNPEDFREILSKLSTEPEKEEANELILRNGHIFEWNSKPHRLGNAIAGRVWSFRDISQRKQLELKLAFQTDYDQLTGLPNRKLLYDRIIHGIRFAKRHHSKLLLIVLDIDNFKLINDNLGHETGDQLLQQITQRLKLATRESDTLARFGGDEFVILYTIKSYSHVAMLCHRILSVVTKPIYIHPHEIVVTASLGVSLYPKDASEVVSLLTNAEMAMYQAKNMGRNYYQLYDETIRNHARQNLQLQMELRNALAKKEFFLLYQPIVHLDSGRIVGVEALLRWQHPSRGIILPQDFIAIAEDSGIIIPLGEWIFKRACTQNKEWQDKGLPPIRMAINVSGVQLLRDDFIACIERCLKESGLPPDYIEIELTESVIMDKEQQHINLLKLLKRKGIQLSIDDFGTGYSSLSYLRDFPVSKIKIDQSFIEKCPSDPNNNSIVEAIIAMSHGLKMRVLAEGIESREQLQFLKDLGCDEGQGFYFNQALTGDEIARLLGLREEG
ncbi:inner membrane protein [Legionella birminghamensis]|uniref:cyclic-guanylate-specific phosphodiesterase n=1 Tax=Legionella birminghamensis TaxID=28083 RepID=A0A378I6W6_9GAMM|nr:EAL domain-containing protein [Legionella birminghamensis]KTC70211.1 inner membrane protein [Legionella birminghamensis]STX30381.1 inner membrane protein [Legionella birminghamensis]